MTKWFDKLVYFIYDSLGILLPGAIFTHFFYYILTKENPFKTLKAYFSGENLKEIHTIYIIIFYLISMYIVGNIVKIISQLFYDFFECIFDDWIFKSCKSKEKKFKYGIRCFFCFHYSSYYYQVEKRPIINFLKKYFFWIFSFKPKYFMEANEFMIKEIIDKINKNSRTSLKTEWYSVYKLGKLYEENKGIKTLSSIFLAKYTMYRSLSFLFFCNFIVAIVSDSYLYKLRENHSVVFLGILFISWLSFHIKYKKYYAFCGNEILVALYYKLVLETEEVKNEIIIC